MGKFNFKDEKDFNEAMRIAGAFYIAEIPNMIKLKNTTDVVFFSGAWLQLG